MKACLVLLLALFLLPAPGRAAELSDAVGMDELTGAAEEYLDGYLNVDELTGNDLGSGARAILNTGSGELKGALRRAGRSGVLLLAVALLCGLTSSVQDTLGSAGELDPSRLAGAAAVTVIAAADVNSLMGLGRRALEQMSAFSKVLTPAAAAVCAASGSPMAAVARQSATLLFYTLLLTLVDQLLVPLVYAYVAASAAQAALGNEGLKRVAALLKWAATILLSGLLTVFVLYLNFSGAAAGNADALTQKAAKTAISGMVPVVGKILSDAAETVVAGAGLLRGTVGVVGLLTVLAICLVPFFQLGCHYLVYKCAAALAATAAPGPVASLIDTMSSAFALVLGMTGGGALILYAALITSVKAVGG